MTDAPKALAGPGLRDWVLPGGVTFGQVALAEPRLAAALLPAYPQQQQQQQQGGDLKGFSNVDFLGGLGDCCPAFKWKPINICATFTDTAPTTIQGQVASIITSDLWIRKVTYTVRRPNAFAGSIFKAQSDHFNRMNPNVDWRLTIRSFCDYVIAADPTPLENIEMVFECVCPIGFVIGCATSIEADFTLLRALAEDEVPYNVCITLHTVTLPRRYDVVIENALALLSARGIDCCSV